MNWFRASAIMGAAGVALGAFGAHGLKKLPGIDERRLNAWRTGADYHLLHSAVALAAVLAGKPLAAQVLLGSVGVFSGALYAFAWTGNTKFGMVAPVGGLGFIAGWVLLAL